MTSLETACIPPKSDRTITSNETTIVVFGSEGGAISLPLAQVNGGFFELNTHEADAGTLYRLQIDGGAKVPDSASRFQPQNVNGPSEVLNPRMFGWQDESWTGRSWEEAVTYEPHVGAFTPEGTFQALRSKLD